MVFSGKRTAANADAKEARRQVVFTLDEVLRGEGQKRFRQELLPRLRELAEKYKNAIEEQTKR